MNDDGPSPPLSPPAVEVENAFDMTTLLVVVVVLAVFDVLGTLVVCHQGTGCLRNWWCLLGLLVAAKVVAASPVVCVVGLASVLWPCLLAWPLWVLQALATCWSVSTVGPARKTLTTLLILIFGLPLYPVVITVGLALVSIPAAIACVVKVNGFAFAGDGPQGTGAGMRVQSWLASLFCCCRGGGCVEGAPFGSVQGSVLHFFNGPRAGLPAARITHGPSWTPAPLPATLLTAGTLDAVLDAVIYLPYLASWVHLIIFMRLAAFRSEQRAAAASAPPPDDLRFSELLFGIFFAVLSGCTVGPRNAVPTSNPSLRVGGTPRDPSAENRGPRLAGVSCGRAHAGQRPNPARLGRGGGSLSHRRGPVQHG